MGAYASPVSTFFYQGQPNSGGTLYVYQSGTTTPLTVYNDAAFTSPASNPIVLDANGSASFYVSTAAAMKFVVYTPDGVYSETVDPVYPAAGSSGAGAPALNLLPNSDLSICTSLLGVRVGSPIAVSGYSTAAAGVATFSAAGATASHCGGLTPGKLCLVEGSTPPLASFSNGATVSGNNTINSTGGFTGAVVGMVVKNNGGGNASPQNFYRVAATDGANYITLYGQTATPLVNEVATFNLTFYQGTAGGFNPGVNGLPANGDPSDPAICGYPLLVTSLAAGSFNASLSGTVSSAGASSAAVAWEFTPGDDGYTTGNGPDGWKKTPTLKCWRMYQYDWDGVTPVTMPGCAYALKLTKGVSALEQFYCSPAQTSPLSLPQSVTPPPWNLAKFAGKTVCLGAYVWAQAGATVQLYAASDGGNSTSAAVTNTPGYQWQEFSVTLGDSLTYLYLGLNVTGAAGVTALVTQPVLTFGAAIGEGNYVPTRGRHVFSNHPNFFRNWVNANVPSAAYVRLQQESCGCLPGGLKSLSLGFEGINTVPGESANGTEAACLLSDGPDTAVSTPTVYQPQSHAPMVFSSASSTAAANVTSYLGAARLDTAEANVTVRAPYSGVVTAMYCQAHHDPGSGNSYTYTLRRNMANAPLACVTNAGTTQSQDATHSQAVSAGDVLCVAVSTTSGAQATTHDVTLDLWRTPQSQTTMWGEVPVGVLVEQDGSDFPQDVVYFNPNNAGWAGVNLDTSACEI